MRSDIASKQKPSRCELLGFSFWLVVFVVTV